MRTEPNEFAAWVAKETDKAMTLMRSSNTVRRDERVGEEFHRRAGVELILTGVRDRSLNELSLPPKTLLGMVQHQRYYNGRTWPRAWALSLYLFLAHRYYRRRA